MSIVFTPLSVAAINLVVGVSFKSIQVMLIVFDVPGFMLVSACTGGVEGSVRNVVIPFSLKYNALISTSIVPWFCTVNVVILDCWSTVNVVNVIFSWDRCCSEFICS